MTEQQHRDDGMQEQGGTGKALKRRGILAAAGAVVAGIVAKQASEPVAAISGSGDQGALILASNPWYRNTVPTTNTSNESYIATVVQATPNFGNYIGANGAEAVVFKADASPSIDGTKDAIGLMGRGKARGTGVMGLMEGVAYPGPLRYAGVYGGASAGNYGVLGRSTGSGVGVAGSSFGAAGLLGSTGVYGSTDVGVGVNGDGGLGTGVYGNSSGGNGVYGVANTAGTSQVVAGVYGDSTATYGIIGRTTAAGYSGLTAITSTPNVAALGATSTVPNAYAAFFTGTTVVNGNFVATGGSKSAAVKDATGQHRLVYCVESPESWFEDFGKAKLVNGTADVVLDKTFAEIVHTDDYHVFLTEHETHHHLVVSKPTATGFTVLADVEGAALKGKKVSDLTGTFSYRVVAKRKDIAGERLAKFDMPKINHPDPDKLPKPEPPKKP